MLLSNHYTKLVFDLFHDESAFQRTEHGQLAQYVENELLIVLHAGRVHFEQVVVVTRDVVAFRHFRNVEDGFAELLGHFLVDGRQLDAAKDDEALVQLSASNTVT